jgi:hypothetical protein
MAGKDLAASYLTSKHGGHRYAFADHLKDAYRAFVETLGIPYSKDREMLQFAGMWARRTKPGVFIEHVLRQVQANDGHAHAFITDLRFLDEAYALQSQGFVLVRIDRTDLPEADAEWRKHKSEHDLDNFDGFHFVLKNCGSMEHYSWQLDKLWEMVITGAHRFDNYRCTTIK